ncbi:MAG: methionine--tRNA ligase [Actinobacteria bacterium]|nr:methionine--tRNA ligase [Actinomycetota bacterium]
MTRKLLVTSALPYANGSIHLGHLVEHIQTDIFVRFQKLIGNTCYYMCADDSHGTAIMLSAEKKKQPPEEYIDAIRKEHIADFEGFYISHDHYYSTHSEENKQLSEDIYLKASEAGAIKTKDIKQYFCEQTKLFLSDRFIKGECPKCGEPDQYGDACEACFHTYDATELSNPYSVYSGEKPILKNSIHYFFDLSKFKTIIYDWIQEDHVTEPVKNKLEEWFKVGLKDWDISRDAPYFGFLIPNTRDKYFYVWLDAPIGYMATTRHWCDTTKKEKFDTIWKSKEYEIHHFIGKDILYFHTLFWPAMLHVGGYQLPKKVNVHGFLTVNNEKMSKSRGTFILASDYLKHLNPEFLRYYYAAKLTSGVDDLDFSTDDFTNKINSDVLGKVVNIASRLGAIIHKYGDGKLSSISDNASDMIDAIRARSDKISEYYEALEFSKAMKEIMSCADIANQFIDSVAPWSVAKEDAPYAIQLCTAGMNAWRYIMIYLKPVLPQIVKGAEELLDSDSLEWKDLETVIEDTPINKYQHLASRIRLEDVEKIIGQEA